MSETSDAYDRLALFRYRVALRLDRALPVPGHQRAVLWRGAFGFVFRTLVCHDMALDCAACPLLRTCPYPRVFAPSIPDGRADIARLRDPPRPFVLTDPHPDAPSLPAGVEIPLVLTVVGTAVSELPYFVVALRRLGDEGIGNARVRFQVASVRALDAAGMPGEAVFEHGADRVRPVRLALRARDLARPGDTLAKRVRVRFVTPADIRGAAAEGYAEGTGSGAPAFGVLVRRARDRASALATFFGDGPLGHDPRGVGELADGVRLVGAEVTVAEASRRSARTGQRHPIGGVVGTAVYEGEAIAELMPWLRLAEVLGVGKHATFGNGRIVVDVVG